MSEQPDEHLQQIQQQALDEIARLHHEALRHIRHPDRVADHDTSTPEPRSGGGLHRGL